MNFEREPNLQASQFLEDTVLVWWTPQVVQLSEIFDIIGGSYGVCRKGIIIQGSHISPGLSGIGQL